MPRYKGPSRGLVHSVETLLDDTGLAQLKACCLTLGIRQAEVIRRALAHFHITNCLSNPMSATIQPADQEPIP